VTCLRPPTCWITLLDCGLAALRRQTAVWHVHSVDVLPTIRRKEQGPTTSALPSKQSWCLCGVLNIIAEKHLMTNAIVNMVLTLAGAEHLAAREISEALDACLREFGVGHAAQGKCGIYGLLCAWLNLPRPPTGWHRREARCRAARESSWWGLARAWRRITLIVRPCVRIPLHPTKRCNLRLAQHAQCVQLIKPRRPLFTLLTFFTIFSCSYSPIAYGYQQ
jgi:hypothetical protein